MQHLSLLLSLTPHLKHQPKDCEVPFPPCHFYVIIIYDLKANFTWRPYSKGLSTLPRTHFFIRCIFRRLAGHLAHLGFVCFLTRYCVVCHILLGQVQVEILQNGQITLAAMVETTKSQSTKNSLQRDRPPCTMCTSFFSSRSFQIPVRTARANGDLFRAPTVFRT